MEVDSGAAVEYVCTIEFGRGHTHFDTNGIRHFRRLKLEFFGICLELGFWNLEFSPDGLHIASGL